MTPRVVVVGGSIAGLSTALFLSRRGIPATVLERDTTPTPSIDGAGEWRRRATPQSAHSHAFLARSRSILGAEVPAVLDLLDAAGVRSARLADTPPPSLDGLVVGPADRELVVLNARRSTFEWALRQAALDDPVIDLRVGAAVSALVVDEAGRVRGVDTDTGVVTADVVVDAAGKRSPVRAWAGADAAGPADRDVACGITYLTRFYALHDGEPTTLNRGYTHGASFDRYSCLVFPGDDGAFSITFGLLPEDRTLAKALRHPDGFGAAVASIDDIAPWGAADAAQPTSGVAVMASLHNLLRAPTAAEPLGLHVVGDARCVTNPAHTRGTTLALVAALEVATAIAEHPTDALAQRDVMAAFAATELSAWVEDSVGQDADRLARWRPDEAPEQPRWRHRVSNGQAYRAAQRDPAAWRSFVRLQNTLARPVDVLDDPALAEAVDAVAASGWAPPPSPAPAHDDLLALAQAAASVPA